MTHPRLRFARPVAGLSASTRWPLFGGWLPLVAFADPRCHADGRPWDGVNDPGFVTTILVVGWLNRAVSVQVGPVRRKPKTAAGSVDAAIGEMDERIHAARQRSEADDRRNTRQP